MREEVAGGVRQLYNQNIPNLYILSYLVRRSNQAKWNVWCMCRIWYGWYLYRKFYL